MPLKTLLVRVGERINIRAVATPCDDARDKCETLAFLQEQKAARAGDLEKLTALLSDTADDGPPHNEQKFKSLPGTDGIYEFKSHKLRLLCFWDQDLICTHGFLKAAQKTPKSEIQHAERIRRDYFEAKKNGSLIHEQRKK